MAEITKRPPWRPRGSKTKHRLDGIFKKCRCRAWSKCGCPWHLGFKYNGHPYRYSLNKWAGKPTGYHMAQSEAERLRDKLRDLIRDGHAPGSRPDPTPVAETRLTLDDIATRYEAYYAQQTWRGETRRAHRVPLLHQQLDLICRTHIPAAKETTVRFGDKPIAAIVTGDIDAFCEAHRTHMAAQERHRLDPVLPLSPGRAERHGFEYYRHGTLSLYAALNTRTGEVVGRTAARHTSAEFVRFLQAVVETQPRRREMHIIVDNLSAHKTQQVRSFLVAHPHVHLHYTPTYSSWLNQVELWFSKIERDVTARGIFTSVTDLRRKLMGYIKHYNQTATPIRWAYADPSRRIA